MKLTINALLVLAVLASCSKSNPAPESYGHETKLAYSVIKQGKGGKLKPHTEVLVHETIRYLNGEQVFSTKTMGAPLAVRLGKGTIAPRLEECLIGMRAGEVREFTIPVSMIGRRGLHQPIAPDAIVIYSIELVGSPFPKWYRGGEVRSLDPEGEGC